MFESVVVFSYIRLLFVQCSFLLRFVTYFFFFKQKTAYEMRISDWSSDVCSSDLRLVGPGVDVLHEDVATLHVVDELLVEPLEPGFVDGHEIGRASCRERVCQYV